MTQLLAFGLMLTLLKIVEPSHFRGGTISWKPIDVGKVSECGGREEEVVDNCKG